MREELGAGGGQAGQEQLVGPSHAGIGGIQERAEAFHAHQAVAVEDLLDEAPFPGGLVLHVQQPQEIVEHDDFPAGVVVVADRFLGHGPAVGRQLRVGQQPIAAGPLGTVGEFHELAGTGQADFILGDLHPRPGRAAGAANGLGGEGHLDLLSLQPLLLQQHADGRPLVLVHIGFGMDLDDHVHGGDGAHSHGVDRGADLAGGFHGGLAGILGEVAEDDHSARARGRVPLGQVGHAAPIAVTLPLLVSCAARCLPSSPGWPPAESSKERAPCGPSNKNA